MEVYNESTNVFFFLSSRRRHTRSLCEWSSDVCSSDLMFQGEEHHDEDEEGEHHDEDEDHGDEDHGDEDHDDHDHGDEDHGDEDHEDHDHGHHESVRVSTVLLFYCIEKPRCNYSS